MFHMIKSQTNLAPEDILERYKEPHSSDECFEVAVALDQLGRKPHAERMFRRGLQLNMRHVPSLYGLAFIQFQSGHDREGQNWFTRAVRFDEAACENSLLFQRELKNSHGFSGVLKQRLWCLQEIEKLEKANTRVYFEIAKLLFEQSNYKTAIEYFRKVLSEHKFRREAAEYLSYIFEHLYKGEELIEKNLELIEEVENRADLFFNLAMVCQHEQRQSELALHLFYLAAESEPHDPGLRYSLEQAAIEVIGDSKKKKNIDPALMMFAHIYQGSVGVAKKYALELSHFKYPESFANRLPTKLWQDWLLRNEGILSKCLKQWFAK